MDKNCFENLIQVINMINSNEQNKANTSNAPTLFTISVLNQHKQKPTHFVYF